MTAGPGILARLACAVRAWYGVPPWSPDCQLRELRAHMLEDYRLLGGNHIARELIERYLGLAAVDHLRRSHESPLQFRRRLGLDPEVIPHSRPAELLGDDDDDLP